MGQCICGEKGEDADEQRGPHRPTFFEEEASVVSDATFMSVDTLDDSMIAAMEEVDSHLEPEPEPEPIDHTRLSDARMNAVKKQVLNAPSRWAQMEKLLDKPDIQLYREPCQGLYRFSLHMTSHELTDPGLLYKFLMEWEYWPRWDSHCKKLEMIEQLPQGEVTLYWHVKWPMPMSDRDYYFHRRGRIDGDGWYIITGACLDDCKLRPTRNVRVECYESVTAIRRLDDGSGVEIITYYIEDPGGSIPGWLINWATEKMLEPGIKDMIQQCIKYGERLARQS